MAKDQRNRGPKDVPKDDPVAKKKEEHSLAFKAIAGILDERTLAVGRDIGRSRFGLYLLSHFQRVLGPVLTGMLITEAGEFVKIPDFIRDILAQSGFPPIIIKLLNKELEQLFQGIWAVHQERGADKDEPLTKDDVSKGFTRVEETLNKQITKEKEKLMSAMENIPPEQRKKFYDKLKAVTDPTMLAKLSFYGPKLADHPQVINDLADLSVNEWFPVLETLCGPYSPPIMGQVSGALGKAAHGAYAFVAHATQPKPPNVRTAEHMVRMAKINARRAKYGI